MKVKTKMGGIGIGNRLAGFDSCCLAMTSALVTTHQIQITNDGFILLTPSNESVTYCPFCGVKVEHVCEGMF